MMKNLAMLALCAASAQAAVELHAPAAIPQGWRATKERVADEAVFHNVMIGLKRQNGAALKRVAAEVSNPQSSAYLQYPSYEQVADMVRPAAEHTAAVKAWVEEHGATIEQEVAHGDYIKISATAAQLEKMAGRNFVTFEHASGKKVHRMVDGVHVPEEVAAAIDTFSGFQAFPLVNDVPVAFDRNPNAPCAVTPPTFRETYNITQTSSGGARNIQAIAQFQGQYVSTSDLASFCEQYDPASGSCAISKFVADRNIPSQPGVESMLDTEYILPVAFGAETWVYTYQSFDFCGDLLTFSADVLAEAEFPYVISISYGSQFLGLCSAGQQNRFADDLEKLAALGITVLISSGDDGSGHSSRQGVNQGILNPSYPASAPYAVAVGSTYFLRGTSGAEQATTQFGSGGGFSFDFDRPAYQDAAVNTYLSTVDLPPTYGFAQNGRGTPDVSALGENFVVVSGGRFAGCIGGTSASSPSVGAVITLLNNVCLAASGRSLGFVNPLFYQNPGAFRDTQAGTNAIGANREGWSAIQGWDASTGLGTPDFPALVATVRAACEAARK